MFKSRDGPLMIRGVEEQLATDDRSRTAVVFVSCTGPGLFFILSLLVAFDCFTVLHFSGLIEARMPKVSKI